MTPKRLLALTLFAALVAMHSSALRAQHLCLGMRVGADWGDETEGVEALEGNPKNIPNISTHHFMELGSLGGAQLDYWLGNSLALSVELLYNQKGAGLKYNYYTEASPYPIDTATSDVILDYLEIPLFLKAQFGSGNMRPFIFAGPEFGVLLSGKKTQRQSGAGGTFSLAEKNTPSLAADGGFGVSFDLGTWSSIFLDASYSMGLIDDIFQWTGYSSSTYSAMSRDIRLAAGILFPLE